MGYLMPFTVMAPPAALPIILIACIAVAIRQMTKIGLSYAFTVMAPPAALPIILIACIAVAIRQPTKNCVIKMFLHVMIAPVNLPITLIAIVAIHQSALINSCPCTLFGGGLLQLPLGYG